MGNWRGIRGQSHKKTPSKRVKKTGYLKENRGLTVLLGFKKGGKGYLLIS